MGIKLGDAIVYFSGDSSDLDAEFSGAKRKAQSFAQEVGGLVQSAGTIALGGIGIAAAGVMAVASKAIPSASELNEALNASSVVFGEAAGIIQDFGKTSAEAVGMSEASFNQLAAQTGAMLQNYGLDATDAASATVDLGKRAADMASIFNTDVSDAMTAINAAMRGEADPIERFGVSMNMASVEAKALAMGFEKVDGRFEQAALTQARLALLMEQTDSIAGDFTNTSDQLANATRVNEARWEDFMATVGTVGLPIMETFQGILMDIGDRVFPVVEGVINDLLPDIEALADNIRVFVDAVASGDDPIDSFTKLLRNIGLTELAETIDNLRPGVETFVNNVSAALAPIFEWIQNNIQLNDVLIGLGVAIGSVVIPLVVSLLSTIAPIIAVFAGVVLAVALLRKAWETDFMGIRTMFTRVWDEGLKPAFEYAKANLLPKVIEIMGKLGDIWDKRITPALERAGIQLQGDMIPAIGDFLIFAIGLAIEALEGFLDIVENLLPHIDKIAEGIGGVIDTFTEWRRKIADVIREISNLSLPPWLTPGSPTPLEIGLAGINKKMLELANVGQLNIGGGFSAAPAMAGAGVGGNVAIGSVSFYGQSAPSTPQEAKSSADLLRDELKKRGLM